MKPTTPFRKDTLNRCRTKAAIVLLGLGMIVYIWGLKCQPEAFPPMDKHHTWSVSDPGMHPRINFTAVACEIRLNALGPVRPSTRNGIVIDEFQWFDAFGFFGGKAYVECEKNGVIRQFWGVGFPWAIIPALLAYRPTVRFLCMREEAAFRRMNERRRRIEAAYRDHPICRVCGYDMRATRERCPECGWCPGAELQPAKGDK